MRLTLAKLGADWLAQEKAPGQRLRPEAIGLGLLAFAAIWLVLLAYTCLVPPVDNIEQLTWVHSLEWGYFKHPPLPTWLFWLPTRLFGVDARTSYVMGAAITLTAIGLQWHLLSEMRGRNYATVALAAVLCITYYNGRLYYYNHNVVLMLCATASALLCWRAFSSGKLRWWAALGVVIGSGALAKYQIAVTMTSVLVLWLLQRGWRDPVQRSGLLLAALIALVLFVPHLQWLQTHDFAPIRYAIESSLGANVSTNERWLQAGHWLIDQLLNRALPAWLLLAAGCYAMSTRQPALHQQPAEVRPERAAHARALLLTWGLVPLAFMPLIGIIFGAELQMQWGTSFLLFAVPAAMELLGPRVQWSRMPLMPVLKAFCVIQSLLLLINLLTSPRGPSALRATHWRAFDVEALAAAIEAPARRALSGSPICVISGPAATAGALALRLPDRPLVLIDGQFDRSPWIDPQRMMGCSVLELRAGDFEGGQPVNSAFPNLWWRVILPQSLEVSGRR